jgi:hypothetical protein
VILGVYKNNTRCVKKGRLAAANAISSNKIKCQVIGFGRIEKECSTVRLTGKSYVFISIFKATAAVL